MVFIRSGFINDEFGKSLKESGFLFSKPLDCVDIGDVDVGIGVESSRTVISISNRDS